MVLYTTPCASLSASIDSGSANVPPFSSGPAATSDILSLPSLFDLDMYLAVLPHGFTDRYPIFIFFILHAQEAFQLIGVFIRVRRLCCVHRRHDYVTMVSSANLAHNIGVPTLALNAHDDPICPSAYVPHHTHTTTNTLFAPRPSWKTGQRPLPLTARTLGASLQVGACACCGR